MSYADYIKRNNRIEASDLNLRFCIFSKRKTKAIPSIYRTPIS